MRTPPVDSSADTPEVSMVISCVAIGLVIEPLPHPPPTIELSGTPFCVTF